VVVQAGLAHLHASRQFLDAQRLIEVLSEPLDCLGHTKT
jgi:hypothetical protein